MALSEEFKTAAQNTVQHTSDNIIRLKQYDGMYTQNMIFNFLTRTLTVRQEGSATLATILPFSQLDRDMLENLYEFMKSKNRKPVPLPKREENGGDTFSFPQGFGK